MRAPVGEAEILSFVGWKDEFVRNLPSWERWMVLVLPPQGRSFQYLGPKGPVMSRGLRVHHELAPELTGALQEINGAGLWDLVELHSGSYEFRAQRGGSKLSMHGLGLAFDLNATMNARGISPKHTLLGGTPDGQALVALLERRGWTWGGHFPVPDAMHFQWGSGY